MKILVLGHSYVVDSNRQFWNQFSVLNKASVDMVVPASWFSNLINEVTFTNNPTTDLYINKIFPVKCFKKGNGSLYFYNPFTLFKILNAKNYDYIFVFQETWALSTFEIAYLKIFTKNHSTLTYLAVCQNIIKKKLAWIIPWERLITRNIDRILYCTEEIIKVLEWKKITCKTTYFPFTFDQNIYTYKPKKIQNNIIKIGFLGRISSEKGIQNLVEACRILIKEGFQISLSLAGNGPLKNTFNDPFIIYRGTLPHNAAHVFYHEIDILVLPSITKTFWKEQFGRVLVESMASGTPVVGSSSGAIPEVLKTINHNYIFDEGNSHSLSNKIKEVIDLMKSVHYEEELEKSRKLNLENFSHQAVAKKLFSLMQADLIK